MAIKEGFLSMVTRGESSMAQSYIGPFLGLMENEAPLAHRIGLISYQKGDSSTGGCRTLWQVLDRRAMPMFRTKSDAVWLGVVELDAFAGGQVRPLPFHLPLSLERGRRCGSRCLVLTFLLSGFLHFAWTRALVCK